MRRAILLLADGARPDVLQRLADEGRLPNISRHVLEPGSARTATTVFPSTTGPAHLPFLTGLYPGACDVPGIRWFDGRAFEQGPLSLSRFRSYVGPGVYLFDRDLRRDVRTLFHHVRDHANVFGNCTRDLRPERHLTRFTKFRLNLMSFFSTSYGLTDDTCGAMVAEAAERRFVFGVLPGIDSESHKHGVEAPGTLDAYLRLDRAIGLIAGKLGAGRLRDETLLVIVSDHGLSDTTHHFDLEAWLQARRGPVLAHPRLRGVLGGAQSACMVSGNAMAHVHVRGPHGWGDEDGARFVADALCEEPAVDIVGHREGAAIVAVSRRGRARLQRHENGDVSYTVTDGDPFGFGALPARMTDAQARHATADTGYPDALVQLTQLFDSRRTGDVVVTAAPGHDLRARFERPPHRGSHGALHRDHMNIPVWTSRRIVGDERLRSVDVFAALLAYFGLAVPEGIAGRAFDFAHD